MVKRKLISLLLVFIGLSLSITFLLEIDFPQGLNAYFKRAYYSQFGPLVISIELITAGYYLLIGGKHTNFTLAIFGFTALLDIILTQLGFFNSNMPLYGSVIISICALLCLWLAFSNAFKLKSITILKTIASIILGVLTELFFNYQL